MKKVTKALILAAGFGTRFLPQTKAMPKEMLPIVDKPIIQHVVEEVVGAGIQDVIIVTGWNKRSIEDHFDYPFELITKLKEGGEKKQKMLDEVERSANMANFIYLRQKNPDGVMGNAVPIWNARTIIGDEPFMVMFGDDFIVAEPKTRAQQLIEAYETYGGSVLSGLRSTNPKDADRYAFAAGEEIASGIYKTNAIIEKPGAGNAPSDMSIISGYIFTPEIFDAIDHLIQNKMTGAGGEYVYVDALNILRERGQDVFAVEIQNGHYFDTGNKFDYMRTVTEFALKHPEIGEQYRAYLSSLKLS